jgi:hypothetical protein
MRFSNFVQERALDVPQQLGDLEDPLCVAYLQPRCVLVLVAGLGAWAMLAGSRPAGGA